MNTVQITTHCDDGPGDPARLAALVHAICDRFGLSGATIGVGIVDDAEICELNQTFLGHDAEADSGARVFDLIVNGQMAGRQAAQRGHSSEAELALYVAHGLLHQLGFDDASPAQARKMHRTEDEILQHLGYGVVYNGHLR